MENIIEILEQLEKCCLVNLSAYIQAHVYMCRYYATLGWGGGGGICVLCGRKV